MENEFKTARRASGMTIADASELAGLAAVTYASCREPSPGKFRLEELKGIYRAMTPTAQRILLNAVETEICS